MPANILWLKGQRSKSTSITLITHYKDNLPILVTWLLSLKFPDWNRKALSYTKLRKFTLPFYLKVELFPIKQLILWDSPNEFYTEALRPRYPVVMPWSGLFLNPPEHNRSPDKPTWGQYQKDTIMSSVLLRNLSWNVQHTFFF